MALFPILRGRHVEPPPWLYDLIAGGHLARRIHQRFISDLAGVLPRGARVLDIGTGPGYLLRHLACKRPDLDLWGVDFDCRMIRLARREANVALSCSTPSHFVVADAQALPFRGEAFDQIVAAFTLHIWPEPVIGLTEMRRVLRPGGRAWIYEMNRHASRKNLREFSREERLPFPLVYYVFRIMSVHHALRSEDFVSNFQHEHGGSWDLHSVHHLFWRGELRRD